MKNNIPNQQQQRINVDMSNIDPIKCLCGSLLWDQSAVLKELPALQSPTGKVEIVGIGVYICHTCGRELEALKAEIAAIQNQMAAEEESKNTTPNKSDGPTLVK